MSVATKTDGLNFRHVSAVPGREMIAATLDDEDLGEFQVAEYLVFLLALDVYMRYADETVGQEDVEDAIISKGLRVLRIADAEIERLKTYLDEHLPNGVHKTMLHRAMNLRATDPAGSSRRAFMLRTLLSRGGPSTMKGVFTNAKYVRQVREAISASMLDDADKALDVFAAIPMNNARMRNWIDEAAQQAGSGMAAPLPVDAGSNEGSNKANEIVIQNVQQLAATGAEASQDAQKARSSLLAQVEADATTAAAKSLEINQQVDVPLKRSEVVGVAVAAAVAATSDPSMPQNIPEPLRHLDDEQRSAAMTDGRVLVSAGAGAGKTATVAARVAYLVKERRVYPSRIMVTSFNTKSSMELGERIGRHVGGEALAQMSVGTMHSLFKKFIGEYGTHEEKTMLGLHPKGVGGPNGFVSDGSTVARTVQKVWEDCHGKEYPAPKLKDARMAATQWAGNNVSPAQARAEASSSTQASWALWYEMYEGLKGSIPGWKPPCYTKSYESFMGRARPNGIRLGDFTDMLKVFHDLLSRNESVRSAVQKVFDHIIVDEGQDRNTVMAECLDMMAGHITDGTDGKSYWVVGDDKQAINAFQGARAGLFTELDGKEGWKMRAIRTNYRCEPELVEAANKLIAYNDDQIPFEARANPNKARGLGSMLVLESPDEASAALEVVENIKAGIAMGGNVSDNAILSRTNKELHTYETACIIRGIPYARKGASSFFGSPETSAVLSYVQLVTGTDYSKMQASLASALLKPNRFFLNDPKKVPETIERVFRDYAYQKGVDVKSLNPVALLKTQAFSRVLADALAKLTRTGKGFKFDEKIQDLGYALEEMKAKTSDETYTTKDLFDDILGLRGTAIVGGEFVEQSFRESLQSDLRDRLGEDDDSGDDEGETDEVDDGTKGLGNVSFLYQLAQPDPTDDDDALTPPTTPLGFRAKMERYASRMRDLRTDLNAYNKAQKALPPEKRSPPPGVYLGTVHSTKGAQWPNVAVAMPKGKFPMLPPVKPGEPPPDPIETEQKLRDERRLAYVAITRAAKNLTIVCPEVVGGRPAGVSGFVGEAGLRVGENITKLEPPVEQGKQAFDVSKVVWEDLG